MTQDEELFTLHAVPSHAHPGYWCVVCGRYLPEDEDGLIMHDDVHHPDTMDFMDEERPQ